MHSIEELKDQIRDVPGFPIEGVVFKDITTMLTHPGSLRDTAAHLAEACAGFDYQAVAAIESRGFIFGALMAAQKDLPMVLIRKQGKLPADTVSCEYSLEYGSSIVEMHRNSLPGGTRVLIVDDLLATGGTAAAAAELIEMDGCEVAGAAFVVDLEFLEGGKRLDGMGVSHVSLIQVEAEE